MFINKKLGFQESADHRCEFQCLVVFLYQRSRLCDIYKNQVFQATWIYRLVNYGHCRPSSQYPFGTTVVGAQVRIIVARDLQSSSWCSKLMSEKAWHRQAISQQIEASRTDDFSIYSPADRLVAGIKGMLGMVSQIFCRWCNPLNVLFILLIRTASMIHIFILSRWVFVLSS